MERWAWLLLSFLLTTEAFLQSSQGLKEKRRLFRRNRGRRHWFSPGNVDLDSPGQGEFDPVSWVWKTAKEQGKKAASIAVPITLSAAAGTGGMATMISQSAQALIDSSDPDTGVDMEDLVLRRGYAMERHRVTTNDGYILTLFRLPHGQNASGTPAGGRGKRPAVLLQHGVLDSSFAYVANFPHQSLAYILADAGYDVWLGNNRGNRYSRSHVSLSPLSSQFWNFSWVEMAEQDLPAEVNYILLHTNSSRVAYVGHSEGTTQAFAAFSSDKNLASKISVLIGFAPVAFVESVAVPALRAGAALGLDRMVQILGDGVFYLNGQAANVLLPVGCQAMTMGCTMLMDVFAGKSEHLNQSRIHVYATMFPAGTSTKNVRHWVNGMKQKRFGRYDYSSPKENMAHYGLPYSPDYNLSDLSVPMALFSGGNDVLADPEDVEKLLLELPPNLVFKFKQVPSYAHLDFILAQDANELLYPEVLAALATHLP